MMKREKTESDMASGIKHLTHSLSLFFSWSLWSKCIYSLFSTSVSFVTISLFAVSLLFQEYIHTNVNVPLSSTMKQNWMKGKKDFSKLDNNNWRKRRSWERERRGNKRQEKEEKKEPGDLDLHSSLKWSFFCHVFLCPGFTSHKYLRRNPLSFSFFLSFRR